MTACTHASISMFVRLSRDLQAGKSEFRESIAPLARKSELQKVTAFTGPPTELPGKT